MNCSPTLTADEFRTVHNALCELRSVYQSLQGVVREPITDKMAAAIRQVEEGLKGAYVQDNTAFERKHGYYSQVRDEMKFRSTWSIYEIDDFYTPHPYPSDSFVVYTNHWGAGRKHYPVMGPQWIDVWAAADLAVQESGDGHHVFIENFILENGNELHMSTGS